jgi:hypothetical protein
VVAGVGLLDGGGWVWWKAREGQRTKKGGSGGVEYRVFIITLS